MDLAHGSADQAAIMTRYDVCKTGAIRSRRCEASSGALGRDEQSSPWEGIRSHDRATPLTRAFGATSPYGRDVGPLMSRHFAPNGREVALGFPPRRRCIHRFSFQTTNATSRSRGMFCPSFALLLHPRLEEGARETGRRLAPMVPVPQRMHA